jgi:protein phosphatase
VAHVGDSRAYRLRDGTLEQLTADHSLVAELERRGLITAQEARVHPRRNEVLRCIGVDPEVDVDVAPVDVQAGDQYLLCSDGLCGVLTDEEIAAELLRAAPEEAARRLVDAANERGGPDNITVQIARIPAAAGRVARTLEVLQSRPRPRAHLVIAAFAALLALAVLWGLLQR